MSKKPLVQVLLDHGGYEFEGAGVVGEAPIKLRVTADRARAIAIEDKAVPRKTPWAINREDLSKSLVPGSLDRLVSNTSRQKNFYMETLCAAVIYGLKVPREWCTIKERTEGPNGLNPVGRNVILTWIEPRPGHSFRFIRERWHLQPPPSFMRELAADSLVKEWEKMKRSPQRLPTTNDHEVLAATFWLVMGSLPTELELVTSINSDGQVHWTFRRRNNAGFAR